MGKNYSDNLHFIKNTGEELTLKQMFDISEKLIVGQTDEIYGVSTINWEHSPWKQLSLIGDEESSVSRTRRFTYFQILCFCLGKMIENPQSITVWEDKLTWFKSSPQYRALDRIDGEPMEFEWNIFPGFTTMQLCNKVQERMSKMSEKPEEFTGWIIFMSMFNDISWDLKTMNRNAN